MRLKFLQNKVHVFLAHLKRLNNDLNRFLRYLKSEGELLHVLDDEGSSEIGIFCLNKWSRRNDHWKSARRCIENIIKSVIVAKLCREWWIKTGTGTLNEISSS